MMQDTLRPIIAKVYDCWLNLNRSNCGKNAVMEITQTCMKTSPLPFTATQSKKSIQI